MDYPSENQNSIIRTEHLPFFQFLPDIRTLKKVKKKVSN